MPSPPAGASLWPGRLRLPALALQSMGHALSLAEKVTAAGGGEYDLVVSCVSVARAEMAAILPTRTGGTVYFFSMATSFTAAALGAEGVSKDIDMLVGNGYCTGHADETLALLREHKGLRELFIKRYA